MRAFFKSAAPYARDALRLPVADVEAAFEEITGRPPDENSFKIHRGKGAAHRAFFHIAPDKLCYMIGEIVSP